MSAPMSDPLARAHAALREAVGTIRNDRVAKTLGYLVMQAVDEADGLRQAGLDADAVARGLEQTVRDVWPFTRVWHYLCESCGDTGLEMRTCPGSEKKDAICGFQKPHPAHEYGRPCLCKEGIRYQKRERSQDDVVAAAARTQRNRGFTRAGQ